MPRAIVVGATSGIGRELAVQLAAMHFPIGITGRRKNLLDDLQRRYPDKFLISDFDITDPATTQKNLDELVQRLGGLDLLILSSGTGDPNKTLDFSIEKRALDTNVVGFTAVADWALNFFEQQKGGHFVAITSIAGLRGSGEAPAYSATKAFQQNYLNGLRQRVKKFKLPIAITDIRPGFVDTAMAKSDKKFWVATADTAARQIIQAIENRRPVAYVTRRWRILAIIAKILPR